MVIRETGAPVTLPGCDADWFLRPDNDGQAAFEFGQSVDQAPLIISRVRTPRLFRYSAAPAGRCSALVLAGGGYTALMIEREGIAAARWLNSIGVDAYVLVHRFPDDTHGPSAPLDDALEAMRVIRSHAKPGTKVGVIGLSSGGHLASCLTGKYPPAWIPCPSRVGDFVTKPDFLVVGYAPISTNAKGRTVVANKEPLVPDAKQALYDMMQPDAHMTDDAPPTFIIYSGTDDVVPIDNAHRLYESVLRCGGSAELHIFAGAPHGFAFDTVDGSVASWPSLCSAWLRQYVFAVGNAG